ncbi:MAG: SRPBCC domain-containing protein [Archangium sp.]|nr:SRPBCC domain-containing protein [Archangium sp.]
MNPTSKSDLQISTPTDLTLLLTRTFNAPRHLVWEAMFTPEKMRRWMLPPPGFTMTTCECDARQGGLLKIQWKSAEADPAMTLNGVFTEVVPLERAVHTEEFALPSGQVVSTQVEAHEFFEKNGVTQMRITQTFETKAARDEGLGAGEGMEAGYRKLDELLAS